MARRAKRAYDASGRRASAAQTRGAILAAAKHLFVERGYAATTMPAIAAAADVALDTVYASVGKKPALFRLLVETAISGEDVAVPAEQRAYVRAMKAEPDAREKLRIYARAVATIQPRLAPLVRVLQAAAAHDPDLAGLWHEISARRAANMRLAAKDLAATGQLREDLALQQVADILWTMTGPELYVMLVGERGWTAADFGDWLGDAWQRLLLAP